MVKIVFFFSTRILFRCWYGFGEYVEKSSDSNVKFYRAW